MSFDPKGYALSAEDGTAVWFLDTRMTVKAGGDETNGAFTFLEWAAPVGFGPPPHRHDRDSGSVTCSGCGFRQRVSASAASLGSRLPCCPAMPPPHPDCCQNDFAVNC
jgi:hypothetical protein